MKQVPKFLLLKLCQAVIEAAQEMGDQAEMANPGYWEISFEMLAAMKVLIANHPEAEVRDFYLAEIDLLLGKENGDEGSRGC